VGSDQTGIHGLESVDVSKEGIFFFNHMEIEKEREEEERE
jgi:hypothetical protein